MLRNVGNALGHTLLAWDGCLRGLGKLETNREAIARDLDEAWEVLAEPIQTVMRRYGVPNPYEQLKELTRGHRVDGERMREFVQGLGLPEAAEQRLMDLSPATYVGIAADLAKEHGPKQA